jgi:hypothetical protein
MSAYGQPQPVRRPSVVNGRRYLQYDVFTDKPLAGNQLAVFTETAGLTAADPALLAPALGRGGVRGREAHAPRAVHLLDRARPGWRHGVQPRMGANEDPATGSASGPLGCYLVKHGLVPAERVRVGGTSVLVGEGRLRSS